MSRISMSNPFFRLPTPGNSARPTRPPSATQQMLQRAGSAPAVPTMEQRSQYAQSQGYRVNGPDAISYNGRIPVHTSLDQFTPPGPPGSEFPRALTGALLEDTANMQGAADRQFDRNQEQIDMFSRFLSNVRPDLMGQANQSGARMERMGDDFFRQGQDQLDEIRGRADAVDRRTRGDVDAANRSFDRAEADLTGAYERGDAAVSGYEQAISEYEDRTAQDASVTAAGLRRNMQSQMQQIRAGVGPDGVPLTAAERNDMMVRIQGQTAEQVQAAITPIFSRFNEAKASMEQVLGSLRMDNARLHLAGGQLRSQLGAQRLQGAQLSAQTGLAANEQILAGQKGLRDLMELGSNVYRFTAELRNSALLNAVNLEAQGRTALAGLVQQNPETVVSWFQGLMAMYSTTMAASPGGAGGGGGGGQTRQREAQQGPQIGAQARGGWTPWQGSGGNPSNASGGYTSQRPGTSMAPGTPGSPVQGSPSRR